MDKYYITKEQALGLIDEDDDNYEELKEGVSKSDVFVVDEKSGELETFKLNPTGILCDICKQSIAEETKDTKEPFVPHHRCTECYDDAITPDYDLSDSDTIGFDVCCSCYSRGNTTTPSKPWHLTSHNLVFIDTPEKHVPSRDYAIGEINKMIGQINEAVAGENDQENADDNEVEANGNEADATEENSNGTEENVDSDEDDSDDDRGGLDDQNISDKTAKISLSE